MGHKIFISYKYADSNIKQINNNYYERDTVRTYVDMLEKYIEKTSEHIYKGESDDEDLSDLSDNTIWEKLKDRIYDSTLTIVMISPNMKEHKRDRDQWIPWEISYSLKAVERKNKSGNLVKSSSNAILAIVLPDRNGSYSYFIQQNYCCKNCCRTLYTDRLFNILQKNMFNIKNPDKYDCIHQSTIYKGDSSYILSVTWDDFASDPEKYIEKSYFLQSSIAKYNISVEMED